MAAPLLKTKLYIPPVRPRERVVPRPRLIERLNAGIQLGRKLTLISAPAGFGKTTLLSEWVHQADVAAAWVSLDEADNDPTRFWSYVIAALQTVQAEVGETALAALQAPQPQPLSIEALLTGLINEIAALCADPLLLVLDDLHVITAPQISVGMSFLLDHLPSTPGGVHLILSTRADPPWPLARLRARCEMTELRTEDLRFTRDEARDYLDTVMGFSLSADDIATLDARTEGWIAGLQMAALSMRGRDDAEAFIRAFGGSHRFVLDYLVEEVLDRQPSYIREFMLSTSILERMAAPLCNALIGREDSQVILEQLERDNLFTVPLDDTRHWYRYHHLFADLLQSQLQQTLPERVSHLHRRASEWYEESGLIAEAVTHALAAGAFERAARLIEGNALAMVGYGELDTLARWLGALPGNVVRSRPWLSVACAWVSVFTGRLGAVEPLLQAA